MAAVVRDELQPIPSHTAKPGDIAVWTPTFDHSARFTSVSAPGGRLDEDASRLDTKNGSQPLTNASLRSEEHMSELQSLMRISYAVFCLKKQKKKEQKTTPIKH